MIQRVINLVRNRIVGTLIAHSYRSLTFKTFDIAFREEIEAWSPDLIHAHDLIALPAAMRAAEALRIPVIFDSHELEEHRNPPLSRLERRVVRRVEKRYLKKCAAVTTVSEAIADYLEQEHRIRRPTLLYNSPPLRSRIHNPRWISSPATGLGRSAGPLTDLRLDSGLRGRDFILVYVGNLAVNRGLEVVMAALPQLPEKLCLVTVGRASAAFAREFSQLQVHLGIEDRVRMLDPVGPSDVVEYISQADAAIIPVLPATLSYEFAMPNKLFESAFAGLPIVASDILEIGRFVRRHELGLLYDPFDARDCAEKIYELYSNYDRYKPSQAKVEALKQEYAWEVQEQKLGRIVSEVLGSVPAHLPTGESASKSMP